MLVLITTTVVGALIFAILYWYFKKAYYSQMLCNLTGPTSLPIIGNALAFKDSSLILRNLLEYQKQYNGSFRLMIGFRASVIVCDYNFTEHLLSSTKHLAKSDPYLFLDGWLGTGLLTGAGEKWKKHRKIITPAFHFKILETFLSIFDDASNILVDNLRKHIDGEAVDVFPFIMNFTLDNICESAMGTSVNAQQDPKSSYIESVKEMCRIIIIRTFYPPHQSDTIYKMSTNYQSELKCLQQFDKVTSSVIKNRRQWLKEQGNVKDVADDDDSGVRKKFRLIDVLLKATVDGKPMCDEDIRQEVNTFMFAGHDTTASALSSTMFLLSEHPEIQDKVVTELRTIFGNNETSQTRAPTYQELQDMKYLEMVIKESLRLYPPVPAIGRMQDYPFEYDGNTIPAKIPCILFIYGIHRNEKYFPDPERFDPERFSNENYLGKDPYSYIPFSAGQRNCIGQKFAMLEMKSALSKLLRNFELCATSPKHELQLLFEIVLRSKTGIKMHLKTRKW